MPKTNQWSPNRPWLPRRRRLPAWVYDTDPDVGLGDVDVDDVRGPALHALWSAVEGAARYEWALFTVRGDPVTQNPSDPSSPFLTTADARVLRATVRNGLVAGARYVFVVRAVGADGSRSAETLSDGVTWLPEVTEPPVDAGGIADASADTVVVDAPVVRDEGPPGVDATARASCEGSVAQCHPDLALEGRAGPLGRCTCRATVGGGSDGAAGRLGLSALVAGALCARRSRRRRAFSPR